MGIVDEILGCLENTGFLTFDLHDGWQPLCDFLGVDVPGIPFPRTNSSKEFVHEEWKQE
jgi:hypothetical protein